MNEITALLDTSFPEDAIPAQPFEDWLAGLNMGAEETGEIRNVAMAIQATDAYGVNLSDLQA